MEDATLTYLLCLSLRPSSSSSHPHSLLLFPSQALHLSLCFSVSPTQSLLLSLSSSVSPLQSLLSLFSSGFPLPTLFSISSSVFLLLRSSSVSLLQSIFFGLSSFSPQTSLLFGLFFSVSTLLLPLQLSPLLSVCLSPLCPIIYIIFIFIIPSLSSVSLLSPHLPFLSFPPKVHIVHNIFVIFKNFMFCETRFFRNFDSFAKLRNSQKTLFDFANHQNHFATSFVTFARTKFRLKKSVKLSFCTHEQKNTFHVDN